MIHSASSISLAQRCPRAWWHRYRDKLKPPELTWAQVQRMQARGEQLPPGARSRALGTEVHRLAETYLAVAPERVARAKIGTKHYIDWHSLPGQCLQELTRHLPPAGSVPCSRLERRVRVTVNGVQFQGLIDLVGDAADAASRAIVDNADHKTTGEIRTYALLPDAAAQRLHQPHRSLKNDLQACLYVLARARESKPVAVGGLCRWNYTETKRSRRSLPVVQYVRTQDARTVVEKAAIVAREVAGYESITEAAPDTTACSDYGGCWYRSEGHCLVKRRWGLVLNKFERETRAAEEREQAVGKLTLDKVRKETAKANEEELRKARKAAAKAEAEREEESDAEDEDEDAEDEAPDSEPTPKRKASKAKPAPEPEEDDTDEDDAEEDDAPESEPAPAPKAKAKPASARSAAKAAFDKAVGPDPKEGVHAARTRLNFAFSEFVDALIKAAG